MKKQHAHIAHGLGGQRKLKQDKFGVILGLRHKENLNPVCGQGVKALRTP